MTWRVTSEESNSNTNKSDDSKKEESKKEDGKEETSVFTMTQNGVEITLTYYAVGDEVVRQSTKNVVNYAAAGIADEAEAREILEPLIKQFQGVKGLEHSMEYGATEAIEELTVDYNEADIEEIAELTGSTFSGTESGKKLSMKASRDMLLQSGFTEK